jgi:hypothetical protein
VQQLVQREVQQLVRRVAQPLVQRLVLLLERLGRRQLGRLGSHQLGRRGERQLERRARQLLLVRGRLLHLVRRPGRRLGRLELRLLGRLLDRLLGRLEDRQLLLRLEVRRLLLERRLEGCRHRGASLLPVMDVLVRLTSRGGNVRQMLRRDGLLWGPRVVARAARWICACDDYSLCLPVTVASCCVRGSARARSRGVTRSERVERVTRGGRSSV